MSCEDHRSRFTELLDGALAPQQAAELEQHLATCPACALELANMRAIVDALGAQPASVAPSDVRKRALDAFLAHGRDARPAQPFAPGARMWIASSAAWLTPARAWTTTVGIVVLSAIFSLLSGPGDELSRPGAPRICLPLIAFAGLMPALALLSHRLVRFRRGPVWSFALSAASGALAGQLVLFALCPMLDARAHAFVLHTGALLAVIVLGVILGLIQRLLPAS